MNVLLLSSSSSHFPLALEASLNGTEHACHRLDSLASFLVSPLRAEPFVCVLEIGNLEDVERALIAFEWVERVQPQAPARFLLLIASRHISLGDRAARFRGAEVATLPLPAKNLLFKIDLQARLLQQHVATRAPGEAAAQERGFRARWEAADNSRARVMILKGPGPSRGRWQRAEDSPRGGVRWRWVEADAAPAAAPEAARYDWVVEAPRTPVYDEASREWQVGEPPEADLQVLHKGVEVFSARKAEAEVRAAAASAEASGPPASGEGLASAHEEAASSGSVSAVSSEARETISRGEGAPPLPAGARWVDARAPAGTPEAGERAAARDSSDEGAVLARDGSEGGGGEPVCDRPVVAAAASEGSGKYDRLSSQSREVSPVSTAAPRPGDESIPGANARPIPARPARKVPGAPTAPRGEAAQSGTPTEDRGDGSYSTPVSSLVGSAERETAAEPAGLGLRDLGPRDPDRAGEGGLGEAVGKRAGAAESSLPAMRGAAAAPAPGESASTRAARARGAESPLTLAPARARGVPEQASVPAPRRHERLDAAVTAEAPERTGETERPARVDAVPAATATATTTATTTTVPLGVAAAELALLVASRRARGGDTRLHAESAADGAGRIDLRNHRTPESGEGARPAGGEREEPGPREQLVRAQGSGEHATDGEKLLQSRYYVLRTLEELGDQNSSWQPVDFYRVYLAAKHRYYGVREVAQLFPLWVYVGELAPEFAEREKAWKFYDRAPACLYAKEQLPPALASFLAHTFGLPELLAPDASAAPAPAPNSKAGPGASSAPVLAGDAPATVPAGRVRGFFQRLRVFFTGG